MVRDKSLLRDTKPPLLFLWAAFFVQILDLVITVRALEQIPPHLLFGRCALPRILQPAGRDGSGAAADSDEFSRKGIDCGACPYGLYDSLLFKVFPRNTV